NRAVAARAAAFEVGERLIELSAYFVKHLAGRPEVVFAAPFSFWREADDDGTFQPADKFAPARVRGGEDFELGIVHDISPLSRLGRCARLHCAHAGRAIGSGAAGCSTLSGGRCCADTCSS